MTVERLQSLQPRALAILRVVTGLLFMQHGTEKLFLWPLSPHHPTPVPLLSLFGVGGLLEFFGGMLIVIGLWTRPVAFILAGEMAVAYWMFHFAGGRAVTDGWLPVVNGGDSAIQFCVVFLYFVSSGAGDWSADQLIARKPRHQQD